mgnify:CR=1 FL=1
MAQTAKTAREAREARHRRVRKKVAGTGQRPRLCVFRSASHVYVQMIDDEQGSTLASASTLEPEVRAQRNGKTKTELARLVGVLIAQRASEKGVNQVVFDRAGYRYHGRVQALADAAREGGLRF